MTVDAAERRARMVMSRVCEPGDAEACRLVRDYSAVDLLNRLGRAVGSARSKVSDWAERLPLADFDEIATRADRVSARFVCPGDDEWPERLNDLVRLEGQRGERRGGSPFGLWVRGGGHLRRVAERSVALVGARAATTYGEHVAGELAFACGDLGFVAISGGAYGIDAAAHRGALSRDGQTVSVLAGGVDRLYPAGNSHLLRQVARDGVLVSEAAPGCAPSKSRFLVRNRLIAALSLGTVVVEAGLRSGSLNTARWAMDLDRGVMGVPGPITSTAAAGVHELLRQPGSLLVTDGGEVVEHVSTIGQALAPRKVGAVRSLDRLGLRARRVLDAVPRHRAASSLSIARAAGVCHEEVSALLDDLAALGAVTVVDGGWKLAD